jgi:hypothetical protein
VKGKLEIGDRTTAPWPPLYVNGEFADLIILLWLVISF